MSGTFRSDGDNYDCDVLVIGAGLSGLACATLLQRAGIKTIILEAAARIGGRVHSIYHPEKSTYLADLGPTWVWPKYQPVINYWLKHLNVDPFAQYESGNAIIDFGPERPISTQLFPVQDGIRRLEGGPQKLVENLYTSLRQNTVRLSQQVMSIEIEPDGVLVNTNNIKSQSFKAKKIVLCVPLRIASQTIKLPKMFDANTRQLMDNAPTWMATQAKAVMIFKSPFWRDNNLSGRVASQVGPLAEIHDHSLKGAGEGALFGFLAWPHQQRKSQPDQLKTAIRNQLFRCFGEKGKLREAVHIEDWANNQFICSNYDREQPPTHPEILPDSVREPQANGKIYLGVSETARQSPGLIEGAFISAMETSQQIISQFKKSWSASG